MRKFWWDIAWEDYIYWQTQDKKTLKKINNLLRDLERSDGKSSGKQELLKGNLSGWASVRIDEKNRLVYRITGTGADKVIEILHCKGHY